eukprot:gnl/Chilomastix_cuspidata/460.p1 GENE.gnl/Chilomastix_cuspidata/460~~gnl/Chilomastix_cuspidata/460.p1  ORF type:complete len:587 (+),score=210.92 gnl/Chilomastix_cuspidata/460:30-1790(+)
MEALDEFTSGLKARQKESIETIIALSENFTNLKETLSANQEALNLLFSQLEDMSIEDFMKGIQTQQNTLSELGGRAQTYIEKSNSIILEYHRDWFPKILEYGQELQKQLEGADENAEAEETQEALKALSEISQLAQFVKEIIEACQVNTSQFELILNAVETIMQQIAGIVQQIYSFSEAAAEDQSDEASEPREAPADAPTYAPCAEESNNVPTAPPNLTSETAAFAPPDVPDTKPDAAEPSYSEDEDPKNDISIVRRMASTISSLRAELLETRSDVNAGKEACHAIKAENAALSCDLAEAQLTAEKLAARVAALTSEAQANKRTITALQEETHKLRAELAQKEGESSEKLGTMQRELSGLKQERAAMSANLVELKKLLDDSEKTRMELTRLAAQAEDDRDEAQVTATELVAHMSAAAQAAAALQKALPVLPPIPAASGLDESMSASFDTPMLSASRAPAAPAEGANSDMPSAVSESEQEIASLKRSVDALGGALASVGVNPNSFISRFNALTAPTPDPATARPTPAMSASTRARARSPLWRSGLLKSSQASGPRDEDIDSYIKRQRRELQNLEKVMRESTHREERE